eukprot:g2561.t1
MSTSTTSDTKRQMKENIKEMLQKAASGVFPAGISREAVMHYLLVVNTVTFFLFALDKFLASGAGRILPERIRRSVFGSLTVRLAESVLLTCALVGGSPGAFLAMTLFRHKTQKTTFQFQYHLILFLHVAAIAYIFWTRDVISGLAS